MLILGTHRPADEPQAKSNGTTTSNAADFKRPPRQRTRLNLSIRTVSLRTNGIERGFPLPGQGARAAPTRGRHQREGGTNARAAPTRGRHQREGGTNARAAPTRGRHQRGESGSGTHGARGTWCRPRRRSRNQLWGPANDSGLELPRNQLTSRSEATSKEDLRGQLQALVGPPLGMTRAHG